MLFVVDQFLRAKRLPKYLPNAPKYLTYPLKHPNKYANDRIVVRMLLGGSKKFGL